MAPGRFGDGGLVIAEVGLVRGADLAHDGPARGHDVGHAEGAADLDELAPGDDDLLAAGERVEDENGRGGVVIGYGRGLGAGELAEEPLDVAVAGNALARFEVEGERRVAEGDGGQGVAGRGGEDGAAEAGVHDDAGGVDGRGERGGEFPFEAATEPLDDGRRRDIGTGNRGGAAAAAGSGGRRGDRRPKFVESLTGRGDDGLASEAIDERAGRGLGEKRVEGGDLPVGVRFRRIVHGDLTRACYFWRDLNRSLPKISGWRSAAPPAVAIGTAISKVSSFGGRHDSSLQAW